MSRLSGESMIVNWSAACQDAILSRVLFGGAFLFDWNKLSDIASESLAGLSLRKKHEALEDLSTYLKTKISADKAGEFRAYYSIFARFIMASFHGEDCSIALELGGVDASISATYRSFIEGLVNHRFDMHFKAIKSTTSRLSLEDIRRWGLELRMIKQVTEAALDPSSQSAGISRILSALFQWIKQIVLFIFHKTPPSYFHKVGISRQLVDSFDEIWKIYDNLGLLPMLFQDATARAALEGYMSLAGPIDVGCLQLIKTNYFRTFRNNSLDDVEKDIAYDLGLYESWGLMLHRGALLRYAHDKQAGLDAYLEVFKKTDVMLTRYSANLYACRMQAESVWRKRLLGTKRGYLDKLLRLDDILIGVDKQILAMRCRWLRSVQDVFAGDELFKKANACFEVLLSDEMRALDVISWAEHTCYCQVRSEEGIAEEMNVRNTIHPNRGNELARITLKGRMLSNEYLVSDTFTQTDYLMVQDFKTELGELRKKMLLIHPDKLVGFEQLSEISRYCHAAVAAQRTRYDEVSRAWYASFWYAPAPASVNNPPSTALKERYGHIDWKKEAPTIIKEPKNPLNLSVLALHRDYVQWSDGQESLVKFKLGTKGFHATGMQHALYANEDDAARIESDSYVREHMEEILSRMDWLRDEIEESKWILEESDARAEIEAAGRVAAEERARTEAAARKAADERAETEAAARMASDVKLERNYKTTLLDLIQAKVRTLKSAENPRLELDAICSSYAQKTAEELSYIRSLFLAVLQEHEYKDLLSIFSGEKPVGPGRLGIFGDGSGDEDEATPLLLDEQAHGTRI